MSSREELAKIIYNKWLEHLLKEHPELAEVMKDFEMDVEILD